MDRNNDKLAHFHLSHLSLSARRAWIEIALLNTQNRHLAVALRKESVDRNLIGCVDRAIDISRSPQGERG